jgi:nitrate/nitrite transport system ATP-binding protein
MHNYLHNESAKMVFATKKGKVTALADINLMAKQGEFIARSATPPATIGEILEVDLPRPRDRLKLAEDPHYHHLRGQVMEFLYQKHLKVA